MLRLTDRVITNAYGIEYVSLVNTRKPPKTVLQILLKIETNSKLNLIDANGQSLIDDKEGLEVHYA